MQKRAVIVCVDMADILAETLPRNKHHFADTWIVTAPDDRCTAAVAAANGARIARSNLFFANGAKFNKFAPLEECLAAMGRHGWLVLLDADIVLPRAIAWHQLDMQCIHGMDGRRLLPAGAAVPAENEWNRLPLDPTNPADGSARHSEVIGYFQAFHCHASFLGLPPWHKLDLPTAAGGDSLFQAKWPLSLKRWLPHEVLHIGQPAANWNGVRNRESCTS